MLQCMLERYAVVSKCCFLSQNRDFFCPAPHISSYTNRTGFQKIKLQVRHNIKTNWLRLPYGWDVNTLIFINSLIWSERDKKRGGKIEKGTVSERGRESVCQSQTYHNNTDTQSHVYSTHTCPPHTTVMTYQIAHTMSLMEQHNIDLSHTQGNKRQLYSYYT